MPGRDEQPPEMADVVELLALLTRYGVTRHHLQLALAQPRKAMQIAYLIVLLGT